MPKSARLAATASQCVPPSPSIPHKGLFAINADTCTECEGEYEVPQCQDVCEVDNCVLALA